MAHLDREINFSHPVLLATADHRLRHQCVELLEQANIPVCVSRNKQHAIAILRSEALSVAVLCTSLGRDAHDEFERLAKLRGLPVIRLCVNERATLDWDCAAAEQLPEIITAALAALSDPV